MVANDLRYNILLGVDSLFEGTAPGYNDKQMSAIINRAQRRVFRDMARLFDTDEKIKRILAPVVKRGSYGHSDIILTTDTDITNYDHSTSTLTGIFYTLPSDVAFLKEEYVILDSTVGAGETLTQPAIVLPITYDYFTKNYDSRYKKPCADVVWRMDTELETGNYTVELIYPITYEINDYRITYLRYPTDITVNVGTPASQVDCEIPDSSFQDEIIGEAIKIITASLNDEGYQVAGIEKKFDEN